MKRFLLLAPFFLCLGGCVTKAKYNRDIHQASFLGMMLAQEHCEEKIINQYRFLFGDRIDNAKKKPKDLK